MIAYIRKTAYARSLLVLIVGIAFATAAQAQTAYTPPPQTQAQGQGSTLRPPDYQLLRYEEDYRYLRDPANRRDFFDPVKFIALNKRQTQCLTIGGEIREKAENYQRFPLMQPPTRPYFLQRYMLHADLHFSPLWRFFGQLQSDHQNGYNGGIIQPQSPQVDVFDYNQAFVEYDTFLPGSKPLTLRGGRQEINYGEGRLLSPRESPNVRQSFDGGVVSTRIGSARVDGLALRAVHVSPGIFDNQTLGSQSVWGVYATIPPARGRGSGPDIYILEYDRGSAAFNRSTATEHRNTGGIRVFGQGRGFDFDCEAVGQNGRFDGKDVQAYLAAADVGYTLGRLPLTPRLGLRADSGSGNHDPNGRTLQTFNALYGRGDFYGEINLFSPANIHDLRPSLDLRLNRNATITLDSFFLWRDSVQDGLYSPAIALIAPASSDRSRYIGTLRTAQVVWQLNRHLALTLNYTHFAASRYFHAAGGQNIDYTMGLLDFKF